MGKSTKIYKQLIKNQTNKDQGQTRKQIKQTWMKKNNPEYVIKIKYILVGIL